MALIFDIFDDFFERLDGISEDQRSDHSLAHDFYEKIKRWKNNDF